jgi:hypothetical protein
MLVEAVVDCPACGEALSLGVDTSAGREQSYYEDCAVCCRPMAVRAVCEPGRVESLEVEPG